MRALDYRAKELDLDLPLIRSVLPSNQQQIQQALEQIAETGVSRIGLLGLSFKAGTDDLRESPIVILAETLLGKGYDLRIYDRNVLISRLTGANKDYIEQQIPHIAALLCDDVDELLAHAELLVVGNNAPEFVEALTRTRADQKVLDLVRVPADLADVKAEYQGICW